MDREEFIRRAASVYRAATGGDKDENETAAEVLWDVRNAVLSQRHLTPEQMAHADIGALSADPDWLTT